MSSNKRTFCNFYQILHCVGGEGAFHLQRTLRSGRRIFVTLKLLRTAWVYSRGPRYGLVAADSLAIVNGSNQLRHHRKARSLLVEELGEVELWTLCQTQSNLHAHGCFPGVPVADFLRQCAMLLMLFLTGRSRFLNLFYIIFYESIERVVRRNCGSVSNLVCYNDQPFDMAAIVLAFRNCTNAKTIVVQHGLVLNSIFYFPTNAVTFWAWGELSRKNFTARARDAEIVVKGRYLTDSTNLVRSVSNVQPSRTISILIAPSHIHSEVKSLLTIVDQIAGQRDGVVEPIIAIKLHPATKFGFMIRHFCRRMVPRIIFEDEDMDVLAERYDVLVTKNSTSAVDFMLLNKPVFFSNLMPNEEFPSSLYGMPVEKLEDFLRGESLPCLETGRRRFLREALNV